MLLAAIQQQLNWQWCCFLQHVKNTDATCSTSILIYTNIRSLPPFKLPTCTLANPHFQWQDCMGKVCNIRVNIKQCTLKIHNYNFFVLTSRLLTKINLKFCSILRILVNINIICQIWARNMIIYGYIRKYYQSIFSEKFYYST